jgi:hypothetical protein
MVNFCNMVKTHHSHLLHHFKECNTGFSMDTYAAPYDQARGAYLTAAQNLKNAAGPYKASRDAYVSATATYTKGLYQ